MSYVLSPQSEELVQQMVDSGRYDNANAVLEDALIVLNEQHRLERLRDMVATGDAEIERGEVDLFTPELAAQLRREAREMHRRGDRLDPDVCP